MIFLQPWCAGLLWCGALFVNAQAPYTVGHYLRDRKIMDRVDSAFTARNSELALQLHRTLQSRSPGDLYRRAQLEWEAGEPYLADLRSAFAAGYSFTPDSTVAFHIENMVVLLHLRDEYRTLTDNPRVKRCVRLIQRDQELASGSFTDTLAHRSTVDTLDALIAEGGWPSSYPIGGTGVSIVLAHQHWDKANDFLPYQQLIEQECLAQREDWMVALSTLQQRIRWTARNKTDTITFSDLALPDEDPALPMVAAISERLAVNGSKHLWIHAVDNATASTIADRIIREQPVDRTPADVLEYLKARDFDHPAPISSDRITFVIDPALPQDRFLYRMD
ncbi:MAG TPA: hypothetical protein PLB89_10700 [Flavobacteriales bacterium]|nr:hypothetical protein [Flavobacteriales bacterium]